METRANYILIGTFTLAVIAAAFGFVYWFSSIGQGGPRTTYSVVFDGSVSGLRTGASVLFNGIRVGEVTTLDLNPANPQQVLATIVVDANVPVRADTKAGLDFQGLTGIASLSLRGGTPTSPPLDGKDGEPPVLVADAAASQDVTEAARDVLRKVDTFITDNEGSMKSAIKNIEIFSATLAKNSEKLDQIVGGVQSVVGDVQSVVGDVKGFSATLAEKSRQFDRILAGAEALIGNGSKSGEIAEAARSVRQLAENLDKRTAELTGQLSRFTGAGLREWEQLAVDGRRTLSSIEQAVRNFDRNPQRVIFGGGTSVPQYNGRR